jgi:hypothetical protein
MPQFRWTPEDAAGNDLEPSEAFSTREEAEAWMGESWASLLAGGAEYVKLMEGNRVVYRMGLREE